MIRRLDVLVSEHLGVSREYAKEVIESGKCKVDGKIIIKSGVKLPSDICLVIDAIKPQYVSRGGKKLAKAIKVFNLNLQGVLCMDIGASTGGFTDCMLQNGAKSVIAIENGKAQLHPSLLSDPRVISLENTDIRDICPLQLPYLPQFIAVDLSFISLSLVVPKLSELLRPSGYAVLLIKPQFEVGKTGVGRRGIVRDANAHIAVIKRLY